MSSLLFFGDIVGDPGRTALMKALPALRKEFNASFVIANAENAAGGRGITPKLAQELLRHGVDVITLGDHVWDQKDLVNWIDNEPRVLRPFNLQPGCPGQGSGIYESEHGPIGVMSLLGRTFIGTYAENAFQHARVESARLKEAGCLVQLIDYHAEATSEKVAMGYYLDGYATAVVGTHTHVQTADARVLPGGCAHICDAGMCGPRDSVIGREIDSVLFACEKRMPCKLAVAGWPVQINGVAIELDWQSGKALSITPINRIYEKE